MKPEIVIVTLLKDEKNGPEWCMCEWTGFKRPANVRIIWIGEDHRGGSLPDWSGAEYRCPDGADHLVQQLRDASRTLGIPFKVEDLTGGIFAKGELDQ